MRPRSRPPLSSSRDWDRRDREHNAPMRRLPEATRDVPAESRNRTGPGPPPTGKLAPPMITTLRFSLAARSNTQTRAIHGAIDWPEAASNRGKFTHQSVPWVVMVPGYGASVGRGFFPTAGRTLAAAGIACVRMNYAGSGIGSDLTTFNDEVAACSHTYLDELADLDALITQADTLPTPAGLRLDPARRGAFGHSRGGAMTLVHAAESTTHPDIPACRGVAAWASMSSILRFSPERVQLWREAGHLDVRHQSAGRKIPLDVSILNVAENARERLDLLRAASNLPCPLLVAQGREDTSTTVDDATAIAHAAGPSTVLAIVDGDHVFDAREQKPAQIGALEPTMREPWPSGFAQAMERTCKLFAEQL